MQRLAPRLHSAAAAIALCAALLHPASGVAQPANPGPLAPLSAPEPTLQAATASPELAQALQHLSEAAQNLNKSLPSITCTETGVSEALKHTRVKRRVKFTATLRAVRTPDAGLHESFTLTRINGKPYSRPGYPFPFYTKGGFESALAYFLPRQQPCLVYTLSPGRIDFVTAPDAASRPPCRADGVHGFALLDREGNVTHIERRVPEQSTQDFNLALRLHRLRAGRTQRPHLPALPPRRLRGQRRHLHWPLRGHLL
jgi:hypothetical protein